MSIKTTTLTWGIMCSFLWMIFFMVAEGCSGKRALTLASVLIGSRVPDNEKNIISKREMRGGGFTQAYASTLFPPGVHQGICPHPFSPGGAPRHMPLPFFPLPDFCPYLWETIYKKTACNQSREEGLYFYNDILFNKLDLKQKIFRPIGNLILWPNGSELAITCSRFRH